MTLAHWCIMLAIGSPYVFTTIAKAGAGYRAKDNRNPRDFLAGAQGFARRAHFGQLNSFEVVPAFAAAVLVAQQIGKAPQSTIDALAVGFLVSRVAYGAFYLADQATLRSLAWFAGMGCVAALFFASA